MAKWKKYLIGEWSWKRPFKSLAFIYLTLFLVMFSCSNHFIYMPPETRYNEKTNHILSIQKSDGLKVGLFYLPATPNMPTLLWSHGNGEDIGYLSQRFKSFHARGYGILAYDYPGYGISEGSPSEKGCYDACQTAWNYLTDTLDIAPENIIIYGQSVGSGPACWLASHESSAGLVLVSPLTSAFRTVTRIPIFLGDQYPNIKRIGAIQTPLLIIHGDQDTIIAPWHGKKLYELHPGPKHFLEVKGAAHNDLFILAEDEILTAIDEFRTSL